jgi:hemerythrin-like domain-containing protein
MLRDRSLIPLSHSHQRALGLCVLVRRDLAADGSAGNVARQGERIVEQYNGEIREHFAVEQRVLFPALMDFPGTAMLVRELLAEHTEIAALIEQIGNRATKEGLERFCQLLPEHIRKEERLLFEQAQALLTREQLDELGRRMTEGARS